MKQSRRIKIRGKQREQLDPESLVAVLVAIGLELAKPESAGPESPDSFDAAIEDAGAAG